MGSLTLFIILVVLYVILNVLDGHSTYLVISKTSHTNERNPIARFIFKKIGPLAGVIVIKSLIVPLVFLMFYFFSFKSLQMNIILLVANVLYLLTVINNYNVLKKVKNWQRISEEFSIDIDDD
ncbi:MAG: DUF5658 family protein [Candidatus Cloacimonas sp.]